MATADALRKPPKVIMVSAEATLPRVKAATALGVDGFIVKPFSAGKLIEAVENALRY